MYAAAAAAAPQNQAVTAADHDAAENCRQQRIVVVNHNALEKAQYHNLQEKWSRRSAERTFYEDCTSRQPASAD